jgi:hypothetical protein
MNWSSGVITGVGTTSTFSVPTGATVNVTGATRAITNTTVSNSGTWNMQMDGGASLQLNTTSAFNNGATGVVAFTTANNNAFTTTAGASTFSNLGTIRTTSTGFGQIAVAGGTPFTPATNVPPNNALGDGVSFNPEGPLLQRFPYLRPPNQGNQPRTSNQQLTGKNRDTSLVPVVNKDGLFE